MTWWLNTQWHHPEEDRTMYECLVCGWTGENPEYDDVMDDWYCPACGASVEDIGEDYEE